MSLLYQTAAIRQLETLAYDRQIATPAQLMQRAAHAAWSYCQCRYPEQSCYTIYCGKGNNAGDGLVLSRLALMAGMQVNVILVCGETLSSDEAQQALEDAIEAGVSISHDLSVPPKQGVIIDALLGIGIKGEIREPIARAIALINSVNLPVLAIDVPSGLDVDNGYVHDQVVHADATVTFIAMKPGLLTGKGPACCGNICVNNLALPDRLFEEVTPTAETVLWNQVSPLLRRRHRDAHKGDHGHTLVIGGDYGMGGAVRLAAEAALRVGAGLVTVATRPEHVPIVSGTRPEIMCHQITESDDLDVLLTRCNVVVIGPGLGQTDWAKDLLTKVLATDKLKVLDADALNLLSSQSLTVSNAVLTPHPGEAARMLGCTSSDVQDNRFQMLDQLVQSYQSVVVLKGPGSLLGAMDQLPMLCSAGNPGMATAGMGDVLTGVIGGLIAQGLSLYQAAKAGMLIHALAADAAAEQGGERGLLATDLLEHLRQLVNPDDHC